MVKELIKISIIIGTALVVVILGISIINNYVPYNGHYNNVCGRECKGYDDIGPQSDYKGSLELTKEDEIKRCQVYCNNKIDVSIKTASCNRLLCKCKGD